MRKYLERLALPCLAPLPRTISCLTFPRLAAILLPALLLAGCYEADAPIAPDFVAAPAFSALAATAEGGLAAERVSAGNGHTCALRDDGVVECWGRNDHLFLTQARKAAAIGYFTQVAAGTLHICALRDDGVVECWGEMRLVREAAAGRYFTQMAGGSGHTCALRDDGEVECWGLNNYNQAPPKKTAAIGHYYTQLTAASLHTCALRDDGVAECWGYDQYTEASPMKTAANGHYYTQVTTGFYHTCALRDDGVVGCWGYNSFGVAPATKTAASGYFTQVTAGYSHNCALRDDGVVECWGSDAQRQAPATKTAESGHYTQVAGGAFHTCALRNDGVVECWGDNNYNQAPPVREASPGHTFNGPASQPALDLTAPTITITTPADRAEYLLDQEVLAAYTCADEEGGSGLAACTGTVAPGAAIDTGIPGEHAFTVTATDSAGNHATSSHSYRVVFPFGGFDSPLNDGAVNKAKAGSAVPIKFSLGGDRGLAIFAPGAPNSRPVTCDSGVGMVVIEETSAPGASGLSYSKGDVQYQFVWKTEKSWAKSCRVLKLQLIDGSTRTVAFQFN